jgi:peptidoglycan biosynthesis protein MviN/MurJ (putative lipid II flippase)
MPIKKTNEMSNEELLKQEKTLTVMISLLIVSTVMMIGAGIFIMITKKGRFNTFLIVPLCFSIIFLLNVNSLKELRKEKKGRGL